MTGFGQHTASYIDKEGLQTPCTEVGNGKRVLKRPERQSRLVVTDEFHLQEGNR